MAKAKGRRQIRKAIAEQFSAHFGDLARFDYLRLTRPVKGKARLIGVGVASGIYLLGFAGGFYGFSKGTVNADAFGKLVWMLMVPASVVGSVVWAIMDSRLEYAVRQRIRGDIAAIEASGAGLWRYGAILERLTIKDVSVAQLISLSRDGQVEALDPQDYCAAVLALADALASGTTTIPAEALEEVAKLLEIAADQDD
jgi:hypothetical protein